MSTQIPSIVDVANQAGVSVATASRVMSNSTYPVAETTRQKVLTAARELNYVPNPLARSLKAQRSKLIAVIISDNADPYFAEVTRGAEEVANENGYLTIVCNTDRNPVKELSYLRALLDYHVDGIILAGSGLSIIGYSEQIEAMVQKIIKRNAAVVTLSQHNVQAPSVQMDNFHGACAMTNRLITLGHQRIAFVTGPTHLTVANVRLQGYMAALAEAGITLDPALLLPGDFTQAGGKQAVRSITQMSTTLRPTAVFAANDEMAFGVISGLRQLGWRIPEDMSVCGFGDVPMAQVVVPALTTVHIPLRDLGRMGVQRLLALLNHESVPDLELLPTTIIERDTIAPLPDPSFHSYK